MSKLKNFLGSLISSSGKDSHSLSGKIEKLTGYRPLNIALYQRAFTHPSVTKKRSESNERLELLGDAVLDLIVTDFIFSEFPTKNEGKLTKARTKIVNRNYLNLRAMEIGLEKYVQATPNAHKTSRSIYGDALEALVGALYKDKGIEACSRFVHQKIIRPGKEFDHMVNKETDFKSRVLEWAQKNKVEVSFKVNQNDSDFSSSLLVNEVVKSKGSALSKKKAEQKASEIFWEELNSEK